MGTGAPPWRLIEMQLCEMYSCKPSELRGENLVVAMEHLVCREMVAQEQKLRADSG